MQNWTPWILISTQHQLKNESFYIKAITFPLALSEHRGILMMKENPHWVADWSLLIDYWSFKVQYVRLYTHQKMSLKESKKSYMPHHTWDFHCSSHECSQSWMLQNIFDYNSFGATLAQLLPAIYSDCYHIFKHFFFFSFQAIMQLIKGNLPLVTSVQPWRLLVIVSLSMFLHKSAVKGCPLPPSPPPSHFFHISLSACRFAVFPSLNKK